MTNSKGKKEFCFPKTSNVSRGEAEGNIRASRGNKLTDPKGKSKFYFPETRNVSRSEAEGNVNIEVEGK